MDFAWEMWDEAGRGNSSNSGGGAKNYINNPNITTAARPKWCPRITSKYSLGWSYRHLVDHEGSGQHCLSASPNKCQSPFNQLRHIHQVRREWTCRPYPKRGRDWCDNVLRSVETSGQNSACVTNPKICIIQVDLTVFTNSL